MPKQSSPKNHYQRWTPSDLKQLKKMAKQRIPTAQIATTFKRSIQSIYQKASNEGIVLRGGRNHS